MPSPSVSTRAVPSSSTTSLTASRSVLARRFSLNVQGIDPLERRMDGARDALSSLPPEVAARVTFQRGTAEALPTPDASVDLVLCREMLYVVADLVTVFNEFRRVVTPS